MKIFSKMSGRDRNLLILLLTAVIFYLCYSFVMVPYMTANDLLRVELESAEGELVRAELLLNKGDTLKKQEAALKDELMEKYSVFFSNISQSRILFKLDTLAADAGLPMTSYLPTPEVPSQVTVGKGSYAPEEYPLKNLAFKINPALLEDSQNGEEAVSGQPAPDAEASGEEVAAPQNAVESEDMIPCTDISIGFESVTYESIYNFISTVETMNKTVVLKSIDLTKGEGGLQGQLIFSFYSLPQLDPDKKDGLDFIPVIPPGKANPFN